MLVSAREEAPIPSKAALEGGGGAGREEGVGGGLGDPTVAIGDPQEVVQIYLSCCPLSGRQDISCVRLNLANRDL